MLAALLATVLASAIGVVHAKYQSRGLFVELQDLIRERDRIEEQWGRLQLELGTVGTPVRVEDLARKRLNMRLPRAEEVIVLRRGGGA
jgi:cell division protein FtsL